MRELQLASKEEIRRYARGALVAAGAEHITPAPLAEITAAAGLVKEDLHILGEEIPEGLRSRFARLGGKVLGALAFKEKILYVASDMPDERQRFTEGHELGHDLLPWHEIAYFADNDTTLAPSTREGLEIEANSFSAEILFGLERFNTMADSSAPGIGPALELASVFKTSAHAALRRYAETSARPVALIAYGSLLNYPQQIASHKLMENQCVESASFREKFGDIKSIVGRHLPVGSTSLGTALQNLRGVDGEVHEVVLETRRGAVRFRAEAFSNNRLRFVVIYQRKVLQGRRISARPASAAT